VQSKWNVLDQYTHPAPGILADTWCVGGLPVITHLVGDKQGRVVICNCTTSWCTEPVFVGESKQQGLQESKSNQSKSYD
jgi:hypothetical protein